MTNRIARIAAVSVMALSFALPASAATVAELQAQINALMAQLSSMSGGTAASSFTADLTIGSKGAEVTALQDMLSAGGYLVMPAGVAKGYFGALTKSAVAKWQTAKGISPAAGYFGAKSRAAAGSVAGTPSTPATPAVTGISTPGAEGTIAVSTATVSNATIYSGSSMQPVLAFKVKATNSDVAIQRLKVDLGTNSKVYTRAFSTIYLVDESGKTLASSPLNANTVTKGTEVTPRYTVTLTGFSSVVPKDATKTFTVKVDVMSFSSTDSSVANVAWTFTLQNNAIRGVDGAGIDQYEGTNGLTKDITTGAALSDTASLSLSTAASTPLTQEVIASGGSLNNEADKVTLLNFDLQAKKDNVLLTDLVATVTRTNGAATASSTFLYVGDTLIGTATLSGSTATFSDINYNISKDTTKTFTLKADIRNASAVQTTIGSTLSGTVTFLTAENTVGDTLTNTYLSGSATGNSILVTSAGPVFSLVGTPTLVKGSLPVQNNYATSTAAATFNLKIKAVGSAIMFGSNASGTPMVGNVNLAGTKSFITYLNGAANTQVSASSTDFAVPSSGVSITGNSFTLAQDQEITIPVTYTFQGNLLTGVGVTYGSYSFGLERINWVNVAAGTLNASTFMSGQTNWRTSSVSLP